MKETKKHCFILCISIFIFFFLFQLCQCQNPPADILLNDPMNITGNSSRNCINRNMNDPCTDGKIRYYLYSGNDGISEEINREDVTWLQNSKYNSNLKTVLLIHGYRGGDSLMPMVVLKNAYIKTGAYNIITLDWGEYVRPPCYLQGVQSMKPVAKCAADMLNFLDFSGLNIDTLDCVGHSLGAQMCGFIGQVLTNKKFEKIVGLDPARPLFAFASSNDKLDEKDAKTVEIIHTNPGFYGIGNMQGSVDFCVNNRGVQPYCEKTRNSQLCSHAHAICFMAESLYPEKTRQGYPCSRQCPSGNNRNAMPGANYTMGQFLEEGAKGMYCVIAEEPPYCKKNADDDYGDIRCCPVIVQRTNLEAIEREREEFNKIEAKYKTLINPE